MSYNKCRFCLSSSSSRDATYFQSDGAAGIADDVDDVFAAGILHVLSVHLQQPVAGEESNIRPLVTSNRFGEDNRPLNGTPLANKRKSFASTRHVRQTLEIPTEIQSITV